MEREGYVSLWIGNIKTDDELLEYVELVYTDAGDWLPSQFLKDFNIDIDDFDDDCIERVCLEQNVTSITELISGCSYEDIVIPRYEKITDGVSIVKCNSGILLYNFQYDGNVKSINNKDYEFKFISSVEYGK
ncbi:Immunity protein 22 [Clostridium amylolyticum]|uniref:Immunity protein 22 n=1 Tax=Clostridium amylolyticum TaxID=1121298 RepID=A0A1M6KCU1_9CLOT|nr:immunity 22 family protein [Clostridium amylolyticum]SHJ56724.1 Immunity protein 22 [Clostridium amylolyticum]